MYDWPLTCRIVFSCSSPYIYNYLCNVLVIRFFPQLFISLLRPSINQQTSYRSNRCCVWLYYILKNSPPSLFCTTSSQTCSIFKLVSCMCVFSLSFAALGICSWLTGNLHFQNWGLVVHCASLMPSRVRNDIDWVKYWESEREIKLLVNSNVIPVCRQKWSLHVLMLQLFTLNILWDFSNQCHKCLE